MNKKSNNTKKKTNNKGNEKAIKIEKKDKTVKSEKKAKPLKSGKEINNKSKLRKYRIKNFILISLMILGITGISTIIAFFLYIIFTTPQFDEKKLYNKESTVLLDINGNEYARLGAENRELVTYEELPQVLVDAIVATEDSRFFQHNGLDIARFAKATLGQLTGQAGAGGASTLTMQLAKQSFNGNEASGMAGIIRKFRDIYLSVFKIEKKYTKEEIIEFYVNTPCLGYNTYGVEQASQTYFGKSVRDLTLAEASLLAGIFNAPTAYNPFNSIEYATKRRSTVLNLMVNHGYITEEQKEEAESISVESLINLNPEFGTNKYQAFIDTVTNEVENRTGLNPANVSMTIETTLDTSVQDVLNDLNEEKLGNKWINDKIQIAVAVTSTKDGSITAINGGRNYNGANLYNRAIAINSHPGSTAKPIFDYGPYIEYNNGSTYSPFFDNKMTYSNGTELKNSAGDYMGMISMRTALYRSRNIPAVQAFQQVDKEKIAEFVHNLGIDYGDELYEAMAIGGLDGITPLDLSAAYAAFGRGGYYIEPHSVTKITYNETGEVQEFKFEPVKAMSEETAYMITDILMTATKNGVGGNLKVKNADIASKTGTSTYDAAFLKARGIPSSAAKDNYTNFYSPDYSISIWYGYDGVDVSKDYYTTAINGANQKSKLAALVGNKIFKPNSKFERPSGVVSAKVEWETFPAKSPSDHTPSNMIMTELFKKGTEPSEVSDRYNDLPNPTNGTSTSNGTTVVLSWEAIETPKAINSTYLEEFFKENYRQFATQYYNERISYNQSNIGTIGYEVYQQINGALTPLGYTTDTKYSATCLGDCTFVIKSAYSIFKSNMSSGLTIEVKGNIPSNPNDNVTPPTNQEPPSTNEPNTKELQVKVINACLPIKNEMYNDEEYTKTSNPIIVTYDGKDVTKDVKITRDRNEIDRSFEGVYEIEYTISYNGLTKKAKRKIIIANTCS